jgi:hypothetical protein
MVELDNNSKEDSRGESSGTVLRRGFSIGCRRKIHVRRVLAKTSVPGTYEVGAPT